MSNTINTNFKADITPYEDSTSTSSDIDVAKRVEDAIRELEDYKAQYGGYLNEENLREMERIEVMLKAEMAAIDGSSVNGVAGPGSTEAASDYNKPVDLQPGWNVAEGDTLDPKYIAGDAVRCDGEYVETINFEGRNIAFSLQETDPENETIERLDVKSAGKDLVFTVTYNVKQSDGTWATEKRSTVLKNGSNRKENVIIDATLLGHGITLDASETVRKLIGSDVPKGPRMYFWGTNFDDTISGSQDDDYIVGLAGNDKIDGQAGNDMIFGDGVQDIAGEFTATVDGYTAGNDDLRGGIGMDTIFGGAGIDTGYSSDNSANGDVVNDMGGDIVNDICDAPDPAGWLVTPGWDSEKDEDGAIVLRKNDTPGGEINIIMENLPDRFNMASARKNKDGDLVITFTGHGADGNPMSFDVICKDWDVDVTNMPEAEAVITVNITGTSGNDIIDFSQITDLEHQNINIRGGAGDDIILGVEAKMFKDGIDFADWDTSTARGDASRAADDMLYYEDTDSDNWEGYKPTFDETTGQIVISDDGTYGGDPEDRTCTLVAPDGYDHGYITSADPDGDGIYNTYVVLSNGDGKTVVVRFDDPDLDVNNINIVDRHLETPTVDDDPTIQSKPVELIPVTFKDDMYTLDGGEGDDMIFGIKGSTFVPDSAGGDYVVKVDPTEDASTIIKKSSSSTIEGDTDGDGSLSDDEWKAVVAANATSMAVADTSGDGTIDADEWEAYKASHTNPHPEEGG